MEFFVKANSSGGIDYPTQVINQLAMDELNVEGSQDLSQLKYYFSWSLHPVSLKATMCKFEIKTSKGAKCVYVMNSSPTLMPFKKICASLMRKIEMIKAFQMMSLNGSSFQNNENAEDKLLLKGYKISQSQFMKILKSAKEIKEIWFWGCTIQLSNSFDFRGLLQGWNLQRIIFTRST